MLSSTVRTYLDYDEKLFIEPGGCMGRTAAGTEVGTVEGTEEGTCAEVGSAGSSHQAAGIAGQRPPVVG